MSVSNPSDTKSGASVSSASGEVATTGSAVPSKLQTSKGNTTIADSAVQKIAGVSAREVSGVYALGGGAARTIGALRERIPGSSQSAGQGVAVEVGERQAAIDLDIVTEYGVSIVDLSRAVRRNVIEAVEGMTGLEVTEVNVAVNDIHLPGDENQQEEQRRVDYPNVTGPAPDMPVQEPLDVDALAAATLGCPAVAGLHPGGTTLVASYLPGRRVVGVRADDDRVLVSVVLAHGSSVKVLEKQVREALAPLVGGRAVDVHVADVNTGAAAVPAATATTSAEERT